MITVIIPVFNCMHTLPKVLSGLVSQTIAPDLMEIIVVDDGSQDGSGEYAEKFKLTSPVEVYCFSQSNKGAAAARNVAIRKARGEVLLCLDADIIPTETLVEEHWKFHRQYSADNIAVRGCSLLSPEIDKCQQVVLDQTEIKETAPGPTQLRWTDFVTNNISFKKKFVDEHQLLFDEKMLRNEDVEFGLRAIRHGLQLYYQPKALGYHCHPLNIEQHIHRAKIHSRSYAVWFHQKPELKNMLVDMGMESNYGFVTSRSPLKKRIKFVIKNLLLNALSVLTLIHIGKKLLPIYDNFARKLFQLVYQYHFRTNLAKQEKLLARPR